MQLTAIALAATVLTAAAGPAGAPEPLTLDAVEATRCRDAVHQVRDSAGKPRLKRGATLPGEATAWFAVDRRYDNCRVLVPVADPRDILPEPAPDLGPARLLPAR